MSQPPILGLNIPIIGARPPPEVVEHQNQMMQSMEAMWPLNPFPMVSNGLKVPAYWMGETLLDRAAVTILSQANIQGALSNGPDAMAKLLGKVWQMADMFMQIRPVGRAAPDAGEATSQTTPTTPASTGTEEVPPENSSPESGPRLVVP